MSRRLRLRAAAVVLAVLCAAGGLDAAVACAAGPVRIVASFDRDASLGSSTALDVVLRLDPRRLPAESPTEVSLAYPRDLGLVSSGLGLATCTRPANEFAQVLIEGIGLGGCPANSVMGKGSVRALVRLSDGQAIPEYGTVTLLSGPFEQGRLGLVAFVDAQRPFGARLAFAGEVRGAPAPYGGTLTVRMPAIPGIASLATVSLVELHLTIGAHSIRYYESRRGRLVAYRPDGVQLPARCLAGGFRFRAEVGFADGSRRVATSRTPCPRAVASPADGR